MTSGIGFPDILVSEGTMVLAALVFLACAILLIRKRRTWRGAQKGIAAAVLVVTGLYLAFILWLVVMWSSPPQPPADPQPAAAGALIVRPQL